MQDIYGRTITADGNTYTAGGTTVQAASDAAALSTFNAMAPDGWTPPAPPVQVPPEIDLWKAKAVLLEQPSRHAAGKTLLDDANAAVAAAGGAVALAWGNSAKLTRSSPTLEALGAALGLTAADLDALFVAADAVSI
jgi:hypothetical protein